MVKKKRILNSEDQKAIINKESELLLVKNEVKNEQQEDQKTNGLKNKKKFN